MARRSVSCTAKRQLRNMPSAVRRTRSQLPQNDSVTLAMMPTSPRPSRYRKRSAGADPRPSTGSSGYTAPMAASTSAAGTTEPADQRSSASRGMNSMNRMVTPRSRPKVAKSTISSSFTPRMSTQLTLTGEKPASTAASIPSITWARAERRVMVKKVAGRRESREMLMRRRPAARRSPARARRVAPLVVSDRSVPRAASFSTRTGRWARTVGSPPVMRIPSKPKRSTPTRATRSISS